MVLLVESLRRQVEEEFSLSVPDRKIKELRNSAKRHDIRLAILVKKRKMAYRYLAEKDHC